MRNLIVILGVAALVTAMAGAQQAPDHMPAITPPKDIGEVRLRIMKLDELVRQQTKTVTLLIEQVNLLRSDLVKAREAQTRSDEALKAAQKEIQELKARPSP